MRTFLLSQKCPVCDFEENTIVAVMPDIVNWWDYEKNGEDRPEKHRKNDSAKVWWKCPKCEYSWKSEIASKRAGKGLCPCCDLGIAFKEGVNDALTKCPDIAKDWDYEKNAMPPSKCFITSKDIVFWKCGTCGYEWAGAISGHFSRNKDGTYRLRKCLVCNGKKTFSGAKNLESEYPEIAAEYVPELNSVPLSSLLPNSAQMITWRCKDCKQIISYKSRRRSHLS